jgi:hypothetical protein
VRQVAAGRSDRAVLAGQGGLELAGLDEFVRDAPGICSVDPVSGARLALAAQADSLARPEVADSNSVSVAWASKVRQPEAAQTPWAWERRARKTSHAAARYE